MAIDWHFLLSDFMSLAIGVHSLLLHCYLIDATPITLGRQLIRCLRQKTGPEKCNVF